MIKFADKDTRSLVREMWKTCFCDTDVYMDIYFSQKYKDENTLIYFENDKAVASLQMLPYTITFYGDEVPFYYLAGLCTLPEYRNNGFMGKLILKAFSVMRERNIPLSILVPAEADLSDFYRKYGYEQVFEKGNEGIPLKQILEAYNGNLKDAYTEFDAMYRNKDLCVQKSFADFETIIEEYHSENCPAKYNLSGMARIIDVQYLLNIFAKTNGGKSYMLKVFDPIIKENNLIYMSQSGEVELDTEIKILTRLLFGFKMEHFKANFRTIFEEHHPQMNLMLE